LALPKVIVISYLIKVVLKQISGTEKE
jgi:hypothetical protein